MDNVAEIINGRCKLEEWKEIPDYPNYEVSNMGRVRSKTRTITQSKNKKIYRRVMKETYLKTRKQNSGYLTVWLCKDGISKAFTVHRLVALCFLPYDDSNKDVNHKDGNKTNNCLSNLELTSRSENISHAYKVLGHPKSRSKKVRCVETGEIYNSVVEAGKKCNVSHKSIYHVLSGRNKTAGGLTWKYL